MAELLLLFELDGVLFRDDDPLYGQAIVEAMRELTGAELPDDALAQVEHRGRTARSIARQILRRFGIASPDLRAWCRLVEERYLALLGDDGAEWTAPEGARHALERLAAQHRLSLLSGTPEQVARARLERLELADLFPAGQGAFGCESEERGELIELARSRAGEAAAENTLLAGTTAVDLMTARSAGVGAIALELAESTWPEDARVVRSLPELADEILGEVEPEGPVLADFEPGDWEDAARIYEEGLAAGTLEDEVPSWESWDAAHLPGCRLAARIAGELVGWAALSPVSAREVYRGVAEDSVYVGTVGRNKGVGRMLLTELVRRAEDDGIWTVQAVCFADNRASVALHESCGFRVVGLRERLGRKDGAWRDLVLLERRSPVIGLD